MDLQEGQPVQPEPVQAGSGFAPRPADPAPPAQSQPEQLNPPLTPGGGFAPHPADEVEVDDEAAESGYDEQPPTEIIQPERSFTWQASEYVQHPKSAAWYAGLLGIAVVLCAILLFIHQYTVLAVVAVMAAAIAAIARKQPRILQYSLDEQGLVVDGKSSPYENFRSYSVFQDVGWRTIDLEPSRRLIPNLSIICENDTFDTIESILSEYLPRHDRKLDWVERLTRYLRF